MKRIISIAIIVLLLFSLSGCEYKDIDKRIFILSIGIDLDKDNPKNYRLTFKAAVPMSRQENNLTTQKSTIFTVKASSLGLALRRLKQISSYEPDYGHMKLIVIGKRFVKKRNIGSILAFFVRRRDFQKIAYFAIGEPNAHEILKMTPKSEISPANNLLLAFGDGVNTEYIHGIKLYEIYNNYRTPSAANFCPIISIKNKNYNMNSCVIFNRGKYHMELHEEEVKYFNLLYFGIDTGYLSYKDKKKKSTVGINITSGSAKFKLKNTDSKRPLCIVKVNISGVVEEIQQIHSNLNKDAKPFVPIVKKHVKDLLLRFQRKHVDPFMLGVYYWAIHPKYELKENWVNTKYQKIKFKVIPNVIIQRSGTLH